MTGHFISAMVKPIVKNLTLANIGHMRYTKDVPY